MFDVGAEVRVIDQTSLFLGRVVTVDDVATFDGGKIVVYTVGLPTGAAGGRVTFALRSEKVEAVQ